MSKVNLSQAAHSPMVETIANSSAVTELNDIAHRLASRMSGAQNRAAILALSARNVFMFGAVELSQIPGVTRGQAMESMRDVMNELMDEVVREFMEDAGG